MPDQRYMMPCRLREKSDRSLEGLRLQPQCPEIERYSFEMGFYAATLTAEDEMEEPR